MRNFLLTAVFAFITALVVAQERIAVFPFEDMDNVLTRNEAVMFYQEFSNEFTNRSVGRFSVVPRQDIERLINTEVAFQLTDFSAREKTAEMQRVLNGTQILSGRIGKLGNDIRVIVSLYTYPELVQLPGGTTLSVANKNDLFNRIPELVRNMQNEIASATVQPVPEGLLYEVVDGKSVTITRYSGSATTLNIPSFINGLPVTSIGVQAFYRCESLTSISIPSSVIFIEGLAFSRCESLTSVTIPSSVTSIGYGAFSSCWSLTSVTIPSSVTSIVGNTFSYCISLTSIIIPSSVTSIGDLAFVRCRRLTSVTIPSSVTYIGDAAFAGCESLTSVTIPSSVTYIGYGAFASDGEDPVALCRSLTNITVDSRNPAYASIDGVLFDKNIRNIILYPAGKTTRNYTIPSSVMSIRDSTFAACSSLTSVTIPSSVTSIGDWAFSFCNNLSSLTIPSSVTSIGEGVFYACTSLTNFTVDNRNTVYASIDGVLFDKSIRTIIAYPAGKTARTYTIPSSVTSIGDRAFEFSNLTSLTIPSSVTSIGFRAFNGCSSLTSVTLSRRTQVERDAFEPSVQITYRD